MSEKQPTFFKFTGQEVKPGTKIAESWRVAFTDKLTPSPVLIPRIS